MKKAEAKKRIEQLKKEVRRHRYLYHVKDKIEISDAALDSLKKELFDLEMEFPELVTPDSPTQRVGGKALEKFKKIKHTRPVLSLQDAFSKEDLVSWEERLLKLLKAGSRMDYFAELKIDGLSVVLRYENGIFKTGMTRGDGKVGEDVTQNLKTIEDIPLKLHGKRIPKKLEVRGEVYMTIKSFEKSNKEREKQGLPLFANPRNIAAGSIRQLDPKIAASRQLSFFAFEIITNLGQKTHQEVHQKLERFGFLINKNNRYCRNLDEVYSFIEKWAEKRKKLPYETDGSVVLVNSIEKQKRLGSVGKAERFMIAYKFPAEQSTSVINDIQVQVGRTGALTPVAFLKPTKIAGSTVSRASLHNEDEIKRLDVKIGDTVVIQKAGDIIPEVLKVLKRMRTGKEKEYIFPKKCPICGSKTLRKKGEAAHYCTNKKCFARNREQIIYFVSKKAFDIEGLGKSVVDQMIENDLVSDVADIFKLKKEDLLTLELFADKKAENIINSIKRSKEVEFSKFIIGLGIRHVGEETAFELATYFQTLRDLMEASEEELNAMENLGPIVSKSIFSFFNNQKNKELISKLQKAGVKIIEKKKRKQTGFFAGKKFLITGNLEEVPREIAKDEIRSRGGQMISTVSKNLDYLIVGKNPGSKLKKANEIGIKILESSEFMKRIK